MAIAFKLNGKKISVETNPQMPLLWVLRDVLKLTGTKYGCGVGVCGACTIHFNGVATRACILPVENCDNAEVVTIEGLSSDGNHEVQKAWDKCNVPQCGYCQPGQIMSAAFLLNEKPNPTSEDVDNYMSGNLCRCGTYPRIKEAILDISKNKER